MDFVNYRRDLLPLEATVLARMRQIGVNLSDQIAIFNMLAPLGTKHEAGVFHREHCLRVGLLGSEIGMHFDERITEKVNAETVRPSMTRALLFAGLLHDVGKALVPCCTLGATERWTPEDQKSMEAHVLDGWRMLRDRFDFTAHVIVQHHRFQKHGYPKELPATLQPFSDTTLKRAHHYAIVLTVADVYDASHRVNSATGGKPLSNEEIRNRLNKIVDDVGDLPIHRFDIDSLYTVGVLT